MKQKLGFEGDAMNSTVMHGLAVGLLVSFGIVIGIAIVFATLYRRHLRVLRLSQKWSDPLTPLAGSRRGFPHLPIPHRWLAVRTSNTLFLRQLLSAPQQEATSWYDALIRARERSWFVSPPWRGWTLVIGAAIPDPASDIDRLHRFLTHLSRAIGDVQFFAADRVLNHHAWADLRDGQVIRAYAWAGETLWNQGEHTLDERLLGLVCHDYAESAEGPGVCGGPSEQQNTERVPLLARRWSLDPVEASAHFMEIDEGSGLHRDGLEGSD